MNKNEFKAILMIAKKMDWQNKPVEYVINKVLKMVNNQQCLMLSCIGECDCFEDELLSLAMQDKDKLASSLVVNDYQTLVWWHKVTFMEDMGIESFKDFDSMMAFYNKAFADAYEMEEMTLHDAYCDKLENSYC